MPARHASAAAWSTIEFGVNAESTDFARSSDSLARLGCQGPNCKREQQPTAGQRSIHSCSNRTRSYEIAAKNRLELNPRRNYGSPLPAGSRLPRACEYGTRIKPVSQPFDVADGPPFASAKSRTYEALEYGGDRRRGHDRRVDRPGLRERKLAKRIIGVGRRAATLQRAIEVEAITDGYITTWRRRSPRQT